MATAALLVGLEAKPGREGAVEEFLHSPLSLVKPGPSTFGIIDAFSDEAARETDLAGPVEKAFADKANELFASPLDISKLDVLANKL